MKRKKYTEIEIAKTVVNWLLEKQYDVYQEVVFSKHDHHSADIVAVHPNFPTDVWIIETKTQLSINVLDQAYRWQSNFRSIAVPNTRSPNKSFIQKICREFFIGWLFVYPDTGKVYNNIHLRYPYPDQSLHTKLSDYHKLGIAGSPSGGAITPYKITMMKIQEFIQENPGCTMKDIIAHGGKYHYASTQSARMSIRNAMQTFEKDWCLVNDRDYPETKYFLK